MQKREVNTIITEAKVTSSQRVDIRIGGEELALMVNPETGVITLYSNQPYVHSDEMIWNKGFMVRIDYFGHPYED